MLADPVTAQVALGSDPAGSVKIYSFGANEASPTLQERLSPGPRGLKQFSCGLGRTYAVLRELIILLVMPCLPP